MHKTVFLNWNRTLVIQKGIGFNKKNLSIFILYFKELVFLFLVEKCSNLQDIDITWEKNVDAKSNPFNK